MRDSIAVLSIDSFEVDPNMRGKGISQLILDSALVFVQNNPTIYQALSIGTFINKAWLLHLLNHLPLEWQFYGSSMDKVSVRWPGIDDMDVFDRETLISHLALYNNLIS